MSNNAILVIVGPTASGKSALAVRLARKFGGEIISADSRQVYKGLDIGTGKITRKEMQGIPHHLLDVVDPRKQFSVSAFVSKANEAINLIEAKGALPIIVGGTGFYIDALAGKISLPKVEPNQSLRQRLDKLSKEKLHAMLKKKDAARAASIDPHNKLRLIRALEIVEALGKVPSGKNVEHPMLDKKFVYIGLKPHDLEQRIYKRLIKRIPGIIRETKKLSRKRAHELGLEYRYTSLYLQDKLNKFDMLNKLNTEIRRYAKRQMTWFKRNKKIKWFRPEDEQKILRHLDSQL